MMSKIAKKIVMEKVENSYYHQASFIDKNGQVQASQKVPVVQELARQGLKHLPHRFVQTSPPSDSNLPNLAHGETIPAIDVAKLRVGFNPDPQGRTKELAKLARGAKEWSLFLVRNHGIEGWILDEVKECVKGFFGLSFEEKKDSVGYYMSTDNMGYGKNYVKSEDQKLDWIDRLTMVAAPKDATQGLHVWPQRPPNFRQAVERYAEEARKVLDELLRAIAESLSLDRHAFLQYFEPKDHSEVKVRVNYYPPCPRPDLAIGINPHSDPSALTILMEFGATGGLQVLKEDTDQWITVPWPNDTLLVNFGDLIEIMSNGKLKSSWHRAITQMEKERFSVALFYNPPPNVEIEPVRCYGEMQEDDGYKKVNVGEYVKNYYEISPTVSKEAIMFAKVD